MYERSVIEFVEENVTLEVLVKRVFGRTAKRRNICATIVMTAIKNIGLIYRPQIDCVDIEVPKLTWWENLLGITEEEKIAKYIRKLEKKIKRNIRKGDTIESEIMRAIEERRKQFFATASLN
jgi:hypothetical protein